MVVQSVLQIVTILVHSERKEDPALFSFSLTRVPYSVLTLTILYLTFSLGQAARWDVTDPDVPGA